MFLKCPNTVLPFKSCVYQVLIYSQVIYLLSFIVVLCHLVFLSFFVSSRKQCSENVLIQCCHSIQVYIRFKFIHKLFTFHDRCVTLIFSSIICVKSRKQCSENVVIQCCNSCVYQV